MLLVWIKNTGLFENVKRHIEETQILQSFEGDLVILFNGFQKKSQKTPQNEIESLKN
jgi:phage-related protein